jgi:Fic family protein
MMPASGLPPLKFEPQVWEWAGHRPRGRADREFSAYRSSVPPFIGAIELRLSPSTLTCLNDATAAIVALERDPNVHYAGIAGALLRSESVASSKIERLDVDARALGLAAIDEARPRSDGAQVWANVRAMAVAIDQAVGEPVSPESFHAIHRALMRDDPHERSWAGRFRDVQNWIGGSDECPRDAVHVPPAAERVPPLMIDLSSWCERSDVSPLLRAAVAHAQFETIHPYTDGNGRTGRAIIHTILRRGRLATASIVPTSSALLADINGYFDSLGAYRAGDVDRYLQHFAAATERASTEAVHLGAELRAVAAEWHELGVLRRGSVAATIAAGLLQQPIVSASHHAATVAKPTASTVYRAIGTMVDAGILIEITENRRNRVWEATAVTGALDDFTRRLGTRQPGW